LSIMPYESEGEAVELANDTSYGLASYVHSANLARARAVAAKIRAGRVYVNGAGHDPLAPFGGYKQSGNGRQNGVFGFEEYLEIKAIVGYAPAA
jgi:aldehyde dehydrogenase (NAD+)